MEIAFPKHLQAFLEERIGSGEYDSPQQIVIEGLELFMQRDAELAAEKERLRGMIAKGAAQANRGELLDGEEVFARLRARVASRQEAT